MVTKCNNELKQKRHLCVFVFNNRVDQLLKDYYNNRIIQCLDTRSRVLLARTKWDLMHVKNFEARDSVKEDESHLLIYTSILDPNSGRVGIVFTNGFIDGVGRFRRRI